MTERLEAAREQADELQDILDAAHGERKVDEEAVLRLTEGIHSDVMQHNDNLATEEFRR